MRDDERLSKGDCEQVQPVQDVHYQHHLRLPASRRPKTAVEGGSAARRKSFFGHPVPICPSCSPTVFSGPCESILRPANNTDSCRASPGGCCLCDNCPPN